MEQAESNRRIVLLALGALGGLFCVYAAILGSKGVEPNEKIAIFWGFSFLLLSAYWVRLDAQIRQIGSPYTDGFLLYVLWPFMVPAYAIKVRGARGILYVAGLVFLYVSPMVAYAISYSLAQKP